MINISNDIRVTIQAVDNATAVLKQVKSQLESTFSGGAKGIDSFNSKIKTSTSLLSGMLSTAGGFALAQAGISSIEQAFTSGASALIGYNAKMEQTRVGLETMLGSAGAAEVFISDLKTMAAKTPFEFPQLQDASQKFLAFGFAAKDVIPTLEAVGNAASGLGKGADGINRAVLAIGQIKAKGRVQGEELLQLTELGIPAYAILAEKLKLTGEQVANIGNEGISSKVAIDALVEGMNEQFPDMMKKQSDTAIGMFSTIKDNLSMIFGGLGEGLFDSLKETTAGLRDWTNDILSTMESSGIYGLLHKVFPPEWELRIISIYGTFERLIDVGHEVGSALEKALMPILGVLLDLAEYAIQVALNFTESIMPAIDLVAEHGDILRAVVISITTVFIGLEIQAKLSSASMLASVIASINKIKIALTGLYLAHPILLGVAAAAGIASYAYYKYQEKNENEEKQKADQIRIEEERKAQEKIKKLKEQREALEKHTGSKDVAFGGNKAAKKANSELSRLEKEMNRIREKIGNSFDELNSKILDKTGSIYEIGAAKIKAEIDKIQREVIDPAAKFGLDTTALKKKLEEYTKVMKDELVKTVREAQTDVKLEIQNLLANTVGTAYEVAKAKYDEEMEKIMRKYEAMKIKLGSENIGLADDWKRAAEGKANNDRQMAAPASIDESFKTGLQKARVELDTFYSDMQGLTHNGAMALSNTLNNVFFDAMTGKLKTMQDYFRSFFEAIAGEISKVLAKVVANKILTSMFGNIFGGGIKGFATGGRVTSDTFIAGEKGPELIKMDGSGATVLSANNTESKLAGSKQSETRVAPTFIFNISTPNAESFRQSQAQMIAGAKYALSGSRGL